jgi:hypothetical protein
MRKESGGMLRSGLGSIDEIAAPFFSGNLFALIVSVIICLFLYSETFR